MRREDRKKERILSAVLIAIALVIITTVICFTIREERREEQKEAAQGQQAPETLIIETPDPCDMGSIVIYANGGVYAFYGNFNIENDGKDGNDISITLDGYMEANYPHGEPAAPEIYGP